MATIVLLKLRRIFYNYRLLPKFIVAVGRFLLWQLAVFYCGSWPFFIVAVGRFSLWRLAVFHCAVGKKNSRRCWRESLYNNV